MSLLGFLLPGPLGAQEHHHGSVHTNRPDPKVLPLPKSEDCFFFAIFGDRTSGRPEGLKILEQAVHDANLLDPDLVMTVGDLVQGYNKPEEWLIQMREYKAVMADLRMPWFPVAGNHDVYSRGEGRRADLTNAKGYEKHFGPLWYWFEHKRCAFIVLYSDEGHPDTGEASFSKPDCQKMSPEQFDWLCDALKANKAREHIFLFLHHPRWRKGGYGDDWDKVHSKLVDAGNVRGVFAGHIHHMVYTGPVDGIDYYTLAATGGNIDDRLPAGAGYLHHFNLVTVRRTGIRVATLPVGTVIDPKQITPEVVADIERLQDSLGAQPIGPVVVATDGSAGQPYTVEVRNPAQRPVEITLVPTCRDPRWRFQPDHQHATIPAGESRKITFSIARPASGLDTWFALPTMRVRADYLAKGVRIALREREDPFAVQAPATSPRAGSTGYVQLGRDGCLRVPAARLGLPPGALTIECFVRSRGFRGRRALLAHAAFGLQLYNGKPELRIRRAGKGRFRHLRTDVLLQAGTWHHLAAVCAAGKATLYLDGRPIGSIPLPGAEDAAFPWGSGPLLLGAQHDRRGVLGDFAHLQLDEVRVSTVARYDDRPFEVVDRSRGFVADGTTALLLHLDATFGPWAADHSPREAAAVHVGAASYAADR